MPRHDPRRPSERVGLRGTALRISSLHPNLVDSKSLVAYWREALLVQNVLRGLTRAYRNHPQLDGVRSYPRPCGRGLLPPAWAGRRHGPARLSPQPGSGASHRKLTA
ncbi:pyrimidine dimer DNA glycosylase/endonuclease V [Corynebacterium mastitidis]